MRIETVMQVLKEDGKPAASKSRMWVYASNDRGGRRSDTLNISRTAVGSTRPLS
ncbi:hypothetical protein [Caproicibacter fermentans]|uniref:Transposase n=1 Tax=Caproicibacter fermentans TaxID=2576756 RepID=A0A7G8TA84_9FIRM|nr:hypothetical protein [Caproicibacter fermentans]QNK40525.1 hypothetical protein HCR03_18090 [Caproicibacter fermentans]